jgi:uncharacterized protein (UPF0147 family)
MIKNQNVIDEISHDLQIPKNKIHKVLNKSFGYIKNMINNEKESLIIRKYIKIVTSKRLKK